jgi:hypothetical protein
LAIQFPDSDAGLTARSPRRDCRPLEKRQGTKSRVGQTPCHRAPRGYEAGLSQSVFGEKRHRDQRCVAASATPVGGRAPGIFVGGGASLEAVRAGPTRAVGVSESVER